MELTHIESKLLFYLSIQRFLSELEKSLSTTARKEPLNTTNYLACQRILTEFVKIFDTHGYEKVKYHLRIFRDDLYQVFLGFTT